ncbi:MAG: RidA family protein [Thermoprotei archaeon]
MDFDKKAEELGLRLGPPAKPVASYLPWSIVEIEERCRLLFVSGQLPMENGVLKYVGKLGKDLDVETGKASARLCATNVISIVRAAAGSLNAVQKIIRLEGFVNSSDGFAEQAQVMNGASDLFVDVFGEAGKHARFAVGVNSLPLNAATEVAALILLKP